MTALYIQDEYIVCTQAQGIIKWYVNGVYNSKCAATGECRLAIEPWFRHVRVQNADGVVFGLTVPETESIRSMERSASVGQYLDNTNPSITYRYTPPKDQETVITLVTEPDFDMYVNYDNPYSWEFSSTSSNGREKLTIPARIGSTCLYIKVQRYTGSGSFTLYVDHPSPPPVTWTGKKRALLCGVSDYLNISDLNYCDEDVVDWYNILQSRGYDDIRVLGDNRVECFPRYDGLATKDNIRSMLTSMQDGADHIAFMSSGHGSGDGLGASFLCTWEGGKYHDTELRDDLRSFNGTKIIILDHCMSGGMDEVKELPNMFLSTTCAAGGFGYDMPQFANGAFTYAWTQAIPTVPSTTPLVDIFKIVEANYSMGARVCDRPMSVCTSPRISL
jgi:hypothetical protein